MAAPTPGNCFIRPSATAAGTQTAWQNAGTDFKFNAGGQLIPAVGSIPLNGVTINGVSLGNLTLVTPAGSITQFASTNGQTTVNNMQQNGYAAGQLQTIAVGNNGMITGTFSKARTSISPKSRWCISTVRTISEAWSAAHTR